MRSSGQIFTKILNSGAEHAGFALCIFWCEICSYARSTTLFPSSLNVFEIFKFLWQRCSPIHCALHPCLESLTPSLHFIPGQILRCLPPAVDSHVLLLVMFLLFCDRPSQGHHMFACLCVFTSAQDLSSSASMGINPFDVLKIRFQSRMHIFSSAFSTIPNLFALLFSCYMFWYHTGLQTPILMSILTVFIDALLQVLSSLVSQKPTEGQWVPLRCEWGQSR